MSFDNGDLIDLRNPPALGSEDTTSTNAQNQPPSGPIDLARDIAHMKTTKFGTPFDLVGIRDDILDLQNDIDELSAQMQVFQNVIDSIAVEVDGHRFQLQDLARCLGGIRKNPCPPQHECLEVQGICESKSADIAPMKTTYIPDDGRTPCARKSETPSDLVGIRDDILDLKNDIKEISAQITELHIIVDRYYIKLEDFRKCLDAMRLSTGFFSSRIFSYMRK